MRKAFFRKYFYFIERRIFAPNDKFSNKNDHLPAWRDFKKIISRPLFTIIFKPKMVFSNIDSILRVKAIYESVK